MKNIIIYLFLVTYSTVMLKPVLPYIADAVAHVLFFKDHMQKVHAHHGKSHAHVTVAENAKNDQSGNSSNNIKKPSQENDHIVFEENIIVLVKPESTVKKALYLPILHSCIDTDFPPPKV